MYPSPSQSQCCQSALAANCLWLLKWMQQTTNQPTRQPLSKRKRIA